MDGCLLGPRSGSGVPLSVENTEVNWWFKMLALALGSVCRKPPSFSGAMPVWSRLFKFYEGTKFLVPATRWFTVDYVSDILVVGVAAYFARLFLQPFETSQVFGVVGATCFLGGSAFPPEDALGVGIKPRLIGSGRTHL